MIKTNFKHYIGTALLCSILLVGGCATAPSGGQANAVEPLSAQQTEGMARVIISRDYAAPVLMKANIEFNGQRLGALRNSQYMEVFVPEGDYKLAANFAMARGTTYSIRVVAGESYGWEFVSPVVPSSFLLPKFASYSPTNQPEKYSDMTKVDSDAYVAAQ